jgi:glutamate decarboxylase
VQVVWEKFCRYFEVEPRYLPMGEDRYTITAEQVVAAVDEDTIGVVGIIGTTYTGELEPIAEICAALDKLQKKKGLDIPVHVDAASGGFVVPFLQPDLIWDFRLPRVASINVSGHKYGLTYPGIGFVVWRNADHLPEDLVFRVNYLGGDMPTFTLNFSRPGNQVVGQYYNFLRLGRAGYTHVMQTLSQTARWFSDQLTNSQHFDVIADGSQIPVVAFKLSGDAANGGAPRGYTEFDVSAQLRSYGWQVPAYPLTGELSQQLVQRALIRQEIDRERIDVLIQDLHDAIAFLDAHPPSSVQTQEESGAYHH